MVLEEEGQVGKPGNMLRVDRVLVCDVHHSTNLRGEWPDSGVTHDSAFRKELGGGTTSKPVDLCVGRVVHAN